MSTRVKKIAFFGGSVWGNRGAEAMLMTTIAKIREFAPDTIFYVFSVYPKQDIELVADKNIIFLSGEPLTCALQHFPFAVISRLFELVGVTLPLPTGVKQLRDADMLIDIGGITFADGRALQLLYNVFTIWPAMIMKVPVVKLSQAMGTFKKTSTKSLASYFLPRVKKIFSRGDLTTKYLKDLELDPDLVLPAADVAFSYEPSYSLSNENEAKLELVSAEIIKASQAGKTVISIIPSSLVLKNSRKLGQNYPDLILNLVVSTLDRPVHFVFLPNGSREGSDGTMNNDLVAIQAIRSLALAELPEEVQKNITWVDFDINTRGVRELVALSDGLVTSRFHGMVAGLALCVPTMVIGWSHKYRETLHDFSMDEYAIDFKHEGLKIIKLYKRFIDNLPTIHQELTNHLDDVKASSLSQFDYLRNELSDR